MANLGAANHLQGTLAGYPGVGVGAGQVLGAAPDAGQEEEEDEQDKIFTSALKILAQLLPKPDHPDAGMCDFLPHEALPALLVASTVPDLLSALLRNDSVQEWTKRGSVYFAMLDMIAALGGSESTLPFLFGDERHDKAWSEGLGPWVEGSGQIVWERKVAPKPVKKGRKRKADSPEPLGELVCAAS